MVPDERLSQADREYLLSLARQSIDCYVNNMPLPQVDPLALPPRLLEKGASFVTLTRQGYLRGCVGALEPFQSLVEDVREHAIAAASEDFRFPPVRASELNDLEIEISRLTVPEKLNYEQPDELLTLLRPGIDGVVLRDGMRRATFLPQVWEKVPETEQFLEELCMKMGAAPDLWRRKKLDVLIYQVEEFRESR